MPRCETCGRQSFDGTEPLDEKTCGERGGHVCRLIRDQNTLVAIVRKLIKSPAPSDAETRTLLVLLESVSPSPGHCPRCRQPAVVMNGVVSVHYATNEDRRPCGASWATVLGGIEIVRSR